VSQLVSDLVWQQLDPLAGALPRRTVRRLRWGVLAAVLLAIVLGLVWRSGIVVPRVAWSELASYAYETHPGLVKHEVVLTNRGWTTVTVTGAGRSGPGLELTGVSGPLPATLRPGGELRLFLTYRVTDCAAVSADPWPVPVQVSTWWGTYTAYVDLPTGTARNAPEARSYSGRDPYAVEWQRNLADLSCNP
jgi:hypothetical protein